MRTPKDEREVLAGGYVYEKDGTRAERMTVYVSDYGYMARLDRYVERFPEYWKVERVEELDGDVISKTYSCPVRCISFRSGKKAERTKTREAEVPENHSGSATS